MSQAALGPADVVRQADLAADLASLGTEIEACRACPRLVEWRERVALERRAAFRDQDYWARPVAGFGDPHPGILVVGLAPAAHGGNRTGRVFTGDRSGDWLFASMYRTGLASQPTSTHRDDGLELHGARVLAAVRCAPPDNKPSPVERDTCAPWLDRELSLVSDDLSVVVALGGFAWQAIWSALGRAGGPVPRPRPAFGHGVEARSGHLTVVGCYHPSQQNTFTGRLTEPMLDAVFDRAARLADR